MFEPEKVNIIRFSGVITVAGDAQVIDREESGGDNQVINRIGPIVHGPSVHNLFWGGLHEIALVKNKDNVLSPDNAEIKKTKDKKTCNDPVNAKDPESMLLQIGDKAFYGDHGNQEGDQASQAQQSQVTIV